MIDGSIGGQGQSPVPEKCTIMLLKGSIQLGNENEDITETFIGLQTEGSRS
jgi:hypothetical protein